MGIENTPSIAQQIIKGMKADAKETGAEVRAETAVAAKSAQAANAQTAIFKTKSGKTEKASLASQAATIAKLSKKEKARLDPLGKIKDSAKKHEQKNPELKHKSLMLLRKRIEDKKNEKAKNKENLNAKDIQDLLNEFYPDPTLADDALDFLLDTTEGDLHQEVQSAKNELNETKQTAIISGRNISTRAREASKQGLGTPSELRDVYREFIGNPKDANTRFHELYSQYDPGELDKMIKFIFHSLGTDMKAKGPSIPRGELHALMGETRTLQAIKGVYRFFEKRMNLVNKLFNKAALTKTRQLTHEKIAKSFMNITADSYPSPDKVDAQARTLGIENKTSAKIIVFSQFRDAVREVSMSKIYKSLNHRDAVFTAIIKNLEILEDA